MAGKKKKKAAAKAAPRKPAKVASARKTRAPAKKTAKAAPPKAAAKAAPKGAAKPTPRTPAPPAARASTAAPAVKAPRPAKPAAGRNGLPPFPPLAGLVKYDEPLAKHTTFRIGGPAKVHFTPGSVEAAAGAVAWAKSHGLPWIALGLGSNVLVRDGGFKGLVLKIGKGLDGLTNKGPMWHAGAGLPTPLLARRTADAGFAGIQKLIGVPGTVGGGVFMNAGAHGQDFSGVVQSVTLLNPGGELEDRPRKAIPFSYRRSGLDGHVVLGCTLRLEEDRVDRLKLDVARLIKKRRDGTPFDQPCCGSVFQNPELMTAGRLIEKCGLKGRRVGAAEISSMHANYIVNKGGASADDVLKLIDVARTAVFKEFGLELELEVKVIGDAK